MILLAGGSKIKGITVEIGGDTQGLDRALQDVNQSSRTLQSELNDVQRLLRFNPESTQLMAQRQEILNQQIATTAQKLEQLRSVEHQVQQQFERGDIGEAQFRAFQREIIATEGRMHHFQREAETVSVDVRGTFKKMGAGMANAIAGAAAGAGISEVINKSLESAHIQTQISVGFNVPEESVAGIKNLVTNITAYGVDGEAALEGVRKQFALNMDKSDEYNSKIATSAAVISKSYAGIDLTELIQESNEFGNAIGVSQDDALAMMNTLLKLGFPPDQLDIMSEYGAQLHRAGYNAQEIQGIFAAGVETKSWNIDNLLDGVKEGRIRLAQFGAGVDKTTLGMIKGTNISAGELKKWGAAVAEGGDAGKIAFGEVATELGKVKDSTQRNNIGVQLFGSMWEDQGKKITDALAGANEKTGNLKANQDVLNDSVSKMNADPQVQLNKALGDMNTALTPLMTIVAGFVAQVANWVSQNPQLAAGIAAVVIALGLIVAIGLALIPIIGIMTAENLALAASMIPIVLPILLIIAAFAALIAIGILVAKNWDTIKTKAAADFNELVGAVTSLGARIKAKFLSDLASFVAIWVNMGSNIKKKFNDDVESLKKIGAKIGKFFSGIDLSKIGSDIMHGLGKGIASAASWVYGEAKKIATGIGNKIKSVLHVKSPSRVTIEIGENTGLGLVEGLRNSIGKIHNMSAMVANAAVPDVAQKTIVNNAPNSGGKSFTVNLNSPKALDVREANKEFSRTMHKISVMW